jgi:hypothetical protein
MKGLMPVAIAAVLMVAACDGPYQKAGEKADSERGMREHIGEGPGEAAGRATDKSIAVEQHKMNAAAAAVAGHADNIAEALDKRVDQLEGQAQQLRADTRKDADAMKEAVRH